MVAVAEKRRPGFEPGLHPKVDMDGLSFSGPWSFDWVSCHNSKRFLDHGTVLYLFRTQAVPSARKFPANYDQ